MNIADVKKELSSDEKVLESAFKLETLYKKYKVVIWAIVFALVIFVVGKNVLESMKTATLEEANDAFLTLQTTPDNKEALDILKEKNPALYELYTYSTASKAEDAKALERLTQSSNSVISDASMYTKAALENKATDSVLYKEMAILESAYLALKSGDTKSAKEKLALIDEKSQLYNIASLLTHATLKVK